MIHHFLDDYVLGGHVLMGPLFGTPILLVEGDDDYRIWSQVPRHHVTNLAVIPSMGDEIKRYQRALENIFKCLREPGRPPCGFALIDGDKPKPQPSATNSQDHIRFVKMNCLEAENLFLTDEVLADLSTNWADAAKRISERANEFGQKAQTLKGAESWDRRQVDVKNVIEQISLVLDSKGVHWTSRVGRAIGRQYPKGQLADFLGTEVLAALWPNTNETAA